MTLAWIILTQGNRPEQLGHAIESIERQRHSAEIVVVFNGANDDAPTGEVITRWLPENVGVPGGRHAATSSTVADLLGFLDDDAMLLNVHTNEIVAAEFEQNPQLGAIALRIVSEHGTSTRRHVPRIGSRKEDRSGPVATFLGGACVIRRAAYEAAGGYWPELFFAHEELDLSWRMHEAGYTVEFLADLVAEHPSTPILRHAYGWLLTGRNRVLVARRNLPWLLALPHVTFWLLVGLVRAPGWSCKRSFLGGWVMGWRQTVARRPIRFATVIKLARAGRPPVF